MNTTIKPRATHFIVAAALLISATAATTTHAETTVRLQSIGEAASFSEGYVQSVESWSVQNDSAQSHRNDQFWHHKQSRPQVWISDIGTLLFNDEDGDGYHAGFSLSIDVDSEYGDTEVYAKIYLESDLEPLNLLHKTSRFSVYGTSIGDEYRVDTELRNNFPQGDYNVIIDIHDAWSDRLLDTANARGFQNLTLLPLESAKQQAEDAANYNQHGSHDDAASSSADVVVTEYAGLFHPFLLSMLAAGLWIRRRSCQLERL